MQNSVGSGRSIATQRRRHTDISYAHAAPSQTEAPAHPMTRVLLVDDHRTFADLLAFSLDAEDDFTSVGRAGSVAEAMRMTDELRPDVVVMDVGLPDGDGVRATAQILERHPSVRVLILTAYADQDLFARAARAGASAFLVKDGGLDEVLSALRAARGGTVIVNGELLASLASGQAPERPTDIVAPALTAREHDVLRLLADGEDVRHIAQALSISVSTCRGHVKSLREKLGAHTQLQAVVNAGRSGLLPASTRAAATDHNGHTRPTRPTG